MTLNVPANATTTVLNVSVGSLVLLDQLGEHGGTSTGSSTITITKNVKINVVAQ